jgi:glycolate oxidase FAD binding subunit
MPVATRSVGEAFITIAGRGGVRDDAEARAAAAIDGRVPRWVVRPASLEQLCGIVAVAHDDGLAMAPRGSGAALELGNPPTRLDLVLDLSALDRVIEYNPDDLTVTVQAGITAGALAAVLAPHRQFLPLDPPGAAGRTLGGMTAVNASGPLRTRYGTIRDLLLGVRFVQADGVATWGGAKVVKSVSGYDVPKLLVGSLGTLGVLGELTLRLHPLPEAEGTWLVPLPSSDAAQALVQRILDSPLQPSRVELFNQLALGAASVERTAAGVVVSIGSVEAAVREQGERLAAMARATGGPLVPLSPELWTAIERGLAPSPTEALLHVVSLAARLADTERAIGEALRAAAPRADASIGACAALGTFRVRIAGASVAEIGALTARLRGWVGGLGGSVVIARGPAELRRSVDPWGPIDDGALGLMRALKDAVDPKRVLNPGRFVGGL